MVVASGTINPGDILTNDAPPGCTYTTTGPGVTGFGEPDLVDYSYTNQGCCACATCRNYQVVTSSPLDNITLRYTKCNTFATASRLVNIVVNGTSVTNVLCAANGSFWCIEDVNAIISIVDTGACSCIPS